MQDNETIFNRLIAEGNARNWQDEPGTMISVSQALLFQELEPLRDKLFALMQKEEDKNAQRRLHRAYSHLSAAIKAMRE